MTPHYDCHACREYNELSRRQFLGLSGGTVLAAIGAPAWLPRVAYATDACTDRDIIVSIFLRGAHDGLTMCVPYAESYYYTYRPTLNVPPPDSPDPNRATDLDGFFGFPPAMTPLMPAYRSGDLLVVHACGSHDPSRSHFDAQRFMEVGAPGDPFLNTGWLGRHLLYTAPLDPQAVLRAMSFGYALPLQLVGAPKATPVPDPANYGLTGNPASEPQREAAIAEMYRWVQDPLAAAAQVSLRTIDLLEQIDFVNYVPGGGAVYPNNSLGNALKASAALIRAEVGVEAIAIDVQGWDTHNNQGIFNGVMANLMTMLSQSLSAFHTDILMNFSRNVTVVCMSEFGRRARENGSNGTDHGHGNCMLVLGGYIQGGRVLRIWPGMAPDELFQGLDLEVTIDYRDVLGELLVRRLGNTDLTPIFPGYAPVFRGVTQTC